MFILDAWIHSFVYISHDVVTRGYIHLVFIIFIRAGGRSKSEVISVGSQISTRVGRKFSVLQRFQDNAVFLMHKYIVHSHSQV